MSTAVGVGYSAVEISVAKAFVMSTDLIKHKEDLMKFHEWQKQQQESRNKATVSMKAEVVNILKEVETLSPEELTAKLSKFPLDLVQRVAREIGVPSYTTGPRT